AGLFAYAAGSDRRSFGPLGRLRRGAFLESPVHVDAQLITAPCLFVQGSALVRGPVDGDALEAFRLAEPNKDSAIARRQVAAATLGEPGQPLSADLDHDARADDITMIPAYQLDAE